MSLIEGLAVVETRKIKPSTWTNVFDQLRPNGKKPASSNTPTLQDNDCSACLPEVGLSKTVSTAGPHAPNTVTMLN